MLSILNLLNFSYYFVFKLIIKFCLKSRFRLILMQISELKTRH
nr:MAG TPA: hypothetical protein [Caudoviricetes sp.]